MSNLYMLAVGRVSPTIGVVIVTEQDVDSWREAMDDAIAAQPHVDSDGAYEQGHAHAISGHPFRPGAWEQMTDRVEYAVGYRDASSTLDLEDYLEDMGWL